MARKPVMINRGQNHVTVSWENVDELQGECVLEVVDELKKWAVVYRGEKKEVRVKGLAPCTCYDFRVKRVDGEWVSFKGATNEGPFLVMHLSRAVKVGKMALVRKIAHARPLLLEVENKEMKTPLRLAVEKNDVQMMSLLMSAVSLGHLAVANFLVDKGCNVNTTDINGLNILHYAVDSDNIESVKFALKHCGCVDSKDSNGWTPLLRAAILNCSNDIINLLLENGASKTVKDKNGFDFEKHKKLASLSAA
ncbi:fibronectin type 3 and ankyrin repeat domains 1 protein isoform X2 [Zophobas morio]|uniref:fibronectin type 3 and ankyrin repeat domains 1 protein isoform X2 n=1 Tax=Zophobas morio TaxID=2755281 RepID=UPI0030834A41